MRSWLTGDDLFSWLRMLRASADSRAFLVLEGTTDCQALDTHVNSEVAATFPAFSKPNVERVVELADAQGLEDVLGVLDRDWVGLIAQPLASTNVVYTDAYDLDATIAFAGSALERVVVAHSDREKRAAHLAKLGKKCRRTIIDFAAPIGVVRYLSERHRWEIRTESFPVHEVVAATVDSVDLAELARIAVARSQQPKVTETVLAEALCEELPKLTDLAGMCNGHDLAAAISVLVRHWGHRASRDTIERACRAAFSCTELESTRMFVAIKEWGATRDVRIWNCETA